MKCIIMNTVSGNGRVESSLGARSRQFGPLVQLMCTYIYSETSTGTRVTGGKEYWSRSELEIRICQRCWCDRQRQHQKFRLQQSVVSFCFTAARRSSQNLDSVTLKGSPAVYGRKSCTFLLSFCEFH